MNFNRLGGLKFISRAALLVVVTITSVFGYFVTKVEFNYDFESFFAKDDPETEFFENHRKRFESDNDFIFVAFRRDDGVFEQNFLQRVSSFVDQIREDSLVVDVQSLTHMDDYVASPFSSAVFTRPMMDVENPSNYPSDSARIFSRPELQGYFINEKATALLVLIKHRQYLSKNKGDLLKTSIDKVIADLEINDFVYAGRAIGINYYVDQMQNETGFFIGLSFVLVIIFLVFTFKSIWGVWVPLIVVTFSMVWIVGFMGMVGQPINLILTVLPSIIFVVAMSDVIHLVSKYFDELRLGKEREDAIRTAYKEVGFATLLTSLTTAIGFLTLLTVNMEPVQDFGTYISIGVVMAFCLAYTLLPALLVLVRPPKISNIAVTRNFWYNWLHRTFLVLLKRRFAVLYGFIAVLGIGIYGLSTVEANYFLLEDLKEDSPLRKDYDYFDKEFMGLRPFELAINVKDTSVSVTDYCVLQEIDKIEAYLLGEYGLRHCFSVTSLLKMANRTQHGGQQKYYILPTEQESVKYLKTIRTYDRDNRLLAFVDSTERYTRISSNIGDLGKYVIDERNEEFYKFLNEEVDLNLIDVRITGTGHLLDRNITTLSKKLTFGLLIAVLVVSLLMGFLYRSLKIVILAMIPNIFPMIMLAAILGFGGLNLTVSTAIIFTISFGIAVDDTIHFMSKFKIELNKGKSVLYALKRTYLSTGRAIVLTTLILCSGFLLLMMSDFLGTFFIGFLISATLLFALIADLFLLPVLLILFYKKK